MYRKLFISFAILLSIIFSFTMCFANNDAGSDVVNGIRDVVGGAENAIENGARDISNASKDATGGMEQDANNAGNNMENTNGNNNGNSMLDEGNNDNTAKDTNNETGTAGLMNNNNNAYTATRTATTGDATFMGMGSTAWTWLILGIAAIAIIALVWYYSMQLRNSNYDDRD